MSSARPSHVHTVLLVEDDAGTRDAMRDLLTASGYTVVCARDGTAALDMLKSAAHTCVVVLDLMMSGISGDDFRRAQLADTTVRHIPVILVSGVRDLAERAQTLGAAAFFAKPLETTRLVAAIAQHCGATTAVA